MEYPLKPFAPLSLEVNVDYSKKWKTYIEILYPYIYIYHK